ncbi:unnamed protein product, partial [Didymodactylos carnosus]
MGKYPRAQDKYQWRCRSKGCKLTRSIRDGTFFSNSKLTIQQILDSIYYCSQGDDTHEHLRRHCNFSSEYPAEIGGVGHVVEIDESAWTKRKYNLGRVVQNQWIFGGIDKDTRECFAVTVDRRDADACFKISDRLCEYIDDGVYKLILHEFGKHQFTGCFHIFKKAAIQALPDEKLRKSFQQLFVLGLFDLFVNYRQAKHYLE